MAWVWFVAFVAAFVCWMLEDKDHATTGRALLDAWKTIRDRDEEIAVLRAGQPARSVVVRMERIREQIVRNEVARVDREWKVINGGGDSA